MKFVGSESEREREREGGTLNRDKDAHIVVDRENRIGLDGGGGEREKLW